MPRGRPRKPLAWHLLTNNYRPSKHGPLPAKSPAPEQPSSAPWETLRGNALAFSFAALSDAAQIWCELLEDGRNIFSQLPPDIDETKARRMARRVWRSEVGRELVKFWGEAHARQTWAWQ